MQGIAQDALVTHARKMRARAELKSISNPLNSQGLENLAGLLYV